MSGSEALGPPLSSPFAHAPFKGGVVALAKLEQIKIDGAVPGDDDVDLVSRHSEIRILIQKLDDNVVIDQWLCRHGNPAKLGGPSAGLRRLVLAVEIGSQSPACSPKRQTRLWESRPGGRESRPVQKSFNSENARGVNCALNDCEFSAPIGCRLIFPASCFRQRLQSASEWRVAPSADYGQICDVFFVIFVGKAVPLCPQSQLTGNIWAVIDLRLPAKTNVLV